MLVYVVLSVSLLSSTLLALALILQNQNHSQETNRIVGLHKERVQELKEQLNLMRDQNQDFLNRIMSKDIQAYTTMTSLKNSSQANWNDPYVPQHDTAEVHRLAKLYGSSGYAEGLGDVVNDDELRATFDELGIVGPDAGADNGRKS